MSINLQNLIDAGVNVDELYVLTKEGLAELTKAIFANVNTRIQERIVTNLDETSDENHVPSANVVYDSIKDLSSIKTLTITDGDINSASITPDQKTLYVVRKNSTDPVASSAHVWLEGFGYITLVSADESSDDAELNVMTNELISEIISASYAETDPGISEG